ncbi:hypothetical protein FIM02_01005 [SAR202 cluster bacterium AD-802-E10_MRT_200m]|nr:hypothetical protein [SAR202 cluster bacterium AD-802-E10_MRT_200m]
MARRLMQTILIICMIFYFRNDQLHVSPIEYGASDHLFQIETWVVHNVVGLGFSKVIELVRNGSGSHGEAIETVNEFLSLGQSIREFQSGNRSHIIDRTSGASFSPSGYPTTVSSESVIFDLKTRRGKLRASVESILAEELTLVFKEQGLARGVGPFNMLWPPVSFKIAPVPKLLVVSPRDRIHLQDTQLLDPNISSSDIDLLESKLFKDHGKSVLVLGISGLATYPSLIADNNSLGSLLRTAAHEWLHQYWYFYPFGRSYFDSTEMTTLNETAAEIAGRELGDLAYDRLQDARSEEFFEANTSNRGTKDLESAMKEIRFITDSLLAQERIDEAESFMEEQRLILVDQGYHIRKLNQAYFAFHGTYAESPESVSPIADQLHRLRSQSSNIGEFIGTLSQFDTYEQFSEFID